MRRILVAVGLVAGLLVLPVSVLWCPWHTEILALAVAMPMIAIGLHLYRRDYRRLGRSGVAGVVGSCSAFLGPMLVLGAAGPIFPEPVNGRMVAGYVLVGLGLVLALLAATRFRAVGPILGTDPGRLVVSGPYRWSRNPQYMAASLFPLGYALVLHTPAAYVGFALYLLVAHGLVRIEEEHLEAVFGRAYRRYKGEVRRYLGRREKACVGE